MGSNLPEKKDEEIVKSVQSGDIESFGVLVKRYESKMHRYSKKFIADEEEIKDVVQEIFIKTYKNIRSFNVNKKFSSWLYAIAHNELINALKRKRVKTLPLLELDTFFPYSVSQKDINGEIDRKVTKELIEKCLNELDFKYQEPMILYYFEELNYKEIAEVMRIPVSTVGIRMKRGREKLKNICVKINHKL